MPTLACSAETTDFQFCSVTAQSGIAAAATEYFIFLRRGVVATIARCQTIRACVNNAANDPGSLVTRLPLKQRLFDGSVTNHLQLLMA